MRDQARERKNPLVADFLSTLNPSTVRRRLTQGQGLDFATQASALVGFSISKSLPGTLAIVL